MSLPSPSKLPVNPARLDAPIGLKPAPAFQTLVPLASMALANLKFWPSRLALAMPCRP